MCLEPKPKAKAKMCLEACGMFLVRETNDRARLPMSLEPKPGRGLAIHEVDHAARRAGDLVRPPVVRRMHNDPDLQRWRTAYRLRSGTDS